MKPHENEELYCEWSEIWSKNVDISSQNENVKPGYLSTIYNQLYSELREKEKNQQQLVTWALSILTGTGFFSLILKTKSDTISTIVFALMLIVVTWILCKGIQALVADRMSIGRQLDRIHRIMGGFTKGYYYSHSTLFEPSWYGWGFEPDRDSNFQLGIKYKFLLWILCIFNILLLFTKII